MTGIEQTEQSPSHPAHTTSSTGDYSVCHFNVPGAVAVLDERGREKEHYQVVYGAKLKVEDGAVVQLGQVLVEWDPYTFAILTEIGGTIQFKDLQEGIHPERRSR